MILDDTAQRGDCGVGASGLAAVEACGIRIRREMVAWRQRADRGLPHDVRQRQHAGRLAVKAAREADDIGPLRVGACQADGRFDRLGAAAEKLRPLQIAGRELRDAAHELRTRARGEAADCHRFELRGQRGDVSRVRVAEAGH